MTVSPKVPNKMAVAMGLFWISLAISIIGSNAAGEFSILHSPDSLKFSGTRKTSESLLKEIFSAALGLSVEENSEWNGMYVMDPFNTPEAVVEVYIDGVSSLGDKSALKSKTYPLEVDEYEPDTFSAVQHRIKQRFTSGSNKLVNINLSNRYELESNVFGEVRYSKFTPQKSTYYLKPSVDEDNNFLDELETLLAVIETIKTGAITADKMIDFYNFRFRTLHALSDFHGPNSPHTKEAKKLLGDALQELSQAFVKAYDGSVLVTVVTTDVAHTRRAVRSVGTDGKNSQGLEYEWHLKEYKAENITDDSYNADYPAIFNIILWFVVVLTFSLIAIVYALMDMDPGRDSIIYRMTSTRMKKDN